MKEVPSFENFRHYGLWVEPDLDVPAPQDIFALLDIPEEHDVLVEEDQSELVRSTIPGIRVIYFHIVFVDLSPQL